jgi:hypothetical protein
MCTTMGTSKGTTSAELVELQQAEPSSQCAPRLRNQLNHALWGCGAYCRRDPSWKLIPKVDADADRWLEAGTSIRCMWYGRLHTRLCVGQWARWHSALHRARGRQLR